MAKCSFCGGVMPEFGGRMHVQNDGRIFYFCGSKCWKNWKMGRIGKKLKWTDASRKSRASTTKVEEKK
jgi:large subunit ribosomal protein L24e